MIVPGKSGESELIRRVTSTDPDEVMPPRKSGKTLTRAPDRAAEEVDRPGRDLEPALGVRAAAAASSAAGRGARLGQEPDRRLRPRPARSGEARPLARRPSETTLIRRVSLDLTGLPPSPAEVDAFLADRSPDAYETARRPPAGLARLRRAHGDGLARRRPLRRHQRLSERLRPDHVALARLGHRRLQRATSRSTGSRSSRSPATSCRAPTLAQRIATGFNRNNRTVTEAGSIDEEWRIENAVDRVETTRRSSSGLTMGCARCHDHKFDPISQAEFYQFFGFFNSVNEKGVYTETRGNVPPLIVLPRDRGSRGGCGEFDLAIAVAKAYGTKKHADELVKEKAEYEKTIPSVMVMEETPKPRPTYLLKRGQYDQPDKIADARAGHAVLPAGVCPRTRRATGSGWRDGSPRPDNPLTARVEVNRIWQHHFGIGTGQDRRELRRPGRAAVAPRAARLARDRAGPHRLGRQGDAPADRHQRDLPAGVARADRAPGRTTRRTACWRAGRGSASRRRWCATTRWRSRGC